jgi:hypothetical protein
MPLEPASLHALRRSAWWIQVRAIADCSAFSADDAFDIKDDAFDIKNDAFAIKASISLFAMILGLSEMKCDDFEYSSNPRLAKDRARELS